MNPMTGSTPSADSLLDDRQLLESYQSLERLKYLEEMIQKSTKQELGYAVKLLALIMATSEEGRMALGDPHEKSTEADTIYGLVLHASIALESAKKGDDPIRRLMESIETTEAMARVMR